MSLASREIGPEIEIWEPPACRYLGPMRPDEIIKGVNVVLLNWVLGPLINRN